MNLDVDGLEQTTLLFRCKDLLKKIDCYLSGDKKREENKPECIGKRMHIYECSSCGCSSYCSLSNYPKKKRYYLWNVKYPDGGIFKDYSYIDDNGFHTNGKPRDSRLQYISKCENEWIEI